MYEILHKRCLGLLFDMCGIAIELADNVCIVTRKMQRICLWSKIWLQRGTIILHNKDKQKAIRDIQLLYSYTYFFKL